MASSTSITAVAGAGKRIDDATVFDMGSLKAHLPIKRRGLSNYYSGKSRSFACLSDAKRIEDLEKDEAPSAKRRKYSDRREAVTPVFSPPVSCRDKMSGNSYFVTYVGVVDL